MKVGISVVNNYVGVRATISKAVHRGPTQIGVWPRHHSSRDCDPPLFKWYSTVRFFEVNIGKDDILLKHEDTFDDAGEAGRTFEMSNLSNVI